MAKYIKDFRQGETKTIKINYGAGCDITGWKFWFTLKKEFSDTVPVAQAEHIAGDNSDDDSINGIAYITFDSDESILVKPDKYYYDIRVSKGGTPPIIRTILPPIEDYKDKLQIFPAVTLATI